MNPEKYIEERLEAQINWYSEKATQAKRKFLLVSVANMVAATIIPFLSGLASDSWVRISVGMIGVISATFAGLLTLFKWQENWLQFRATSEALKHEKYMFLTGCAPYDTENRLRALVQRVESMISRENSNWSQYIKQKED